MAMFSRTPSKKEILSRWALNSSKRGAGTESWALIPS